MTRRLGVAILLFTLTASEARSGEGFSHWTGAYTHPSPSDQYYGYLEALGLYGLRHQPASPSVGTGSGVGSGGGGAGGTGLPNATTSQFGNLQMVTPNVAIQGNNNTVNITGTTSGAQDGSGLHQDGHSAATSTGGGNNTNN